MFRPFAIYFSRNRGKWGIYEQTRRLGWMKIKLQLEIKSWNTILFMKAEKHVFQFENDKLNRTFHKRFLISLVLFTEVPFWMDFSWKLNISLCQQTMVRTHGSVPVLLETDFADEVTPLNTDSLKRSTEKWKNYKMFFQFLLSFHKKKPWN